MSPSCAIRSKKTGRRLTSDPIRTSLGLLPSGPDPVGEWLLHRHSPRAFFGAKGARNRGGGRGGGAGTPRFSWCPALPRPSTSCFPTLSKKVVDARVKPGHDG